MDAFTNVVNENQRLKQRLRNRDQRLSALGQKPSDEGVIKDFYVYQEDFADLAFGTSETGNINIQADSDFVIQKMAYFADLDGAAQELQTRVIPLVAVLITDTGSGRNLMETAIPVNSLFGTGELPFILPTPKLFLARSTITISVSNFSTDQTYNLRLSFIGHKVFRNVR